MLRVKKFLGICGELAACYLLVRAFVAFLWVIAG